MKKKRKDFKKEPISSSCLWLLHGIAGKYHINTLPLKMP